MIALLILFAFLVGNFVFAVWLVYGEELGRWWRFKVYWRAWSLWQFVVALRSLWGRCRDCHYSPCTCPDMTRFWLRSPRRMTFFQAIGLAYVLHGDNVIHGFPRPGMYWKSQARIDAAIAIVRRRQQ